MIFEKQNYNVLFISSNEKFTNSVLPLLSSGDNYNVTKVSNGGSARRIMLEEKIDIVLINTPCIDEFGSKLALDFSTNTDVGIMLFVKSEIFDETNARMSPYGVLTISKPTSIAIISQSLSILCATRERIRRMEQKTATIEEKMEEIRLVNRAKWVLIENLKMTEQQAHRYIEKTAMDNCVAKKDVALSIINTYK